MIPSFAQSDFYVSAQADMGKVTRAGFEQNKSVLKTNLLSQHFGLGLSAHYRWRDAISIEAGFGQNYSRLRLNDKSFEDRNDEYFVENDHSFYSWNAYLALRSMLRIEMTNWFLYGQVGFSYNNYGKGTHVEDRIYTNSNAGAKEGINSTSTYLGPNTSFIPEIGIQKRIRNRHLISAGIKLNLGRASMLTSDYTVVDSTTGGTVIDTDKLDHKGGFWALNVKYSFNIHHTPKRERKPKEKKIKDPKEEPIIAENTDTIPTPIDTLDIEGRELNLTHKIKVKAKTVTVKVWDHQVVDGDIISLNLNGEWVLKEYTLEKKYYEFTMELNEGENTFVLHALNLGKYHPNTAAIIINDGVKDHKVVLESNLETSGTMEITFKPDKKAEKKAEKENNDNPKDTE